MTSETTDADWLRQAGRLTAEPAAAWPTDQLLGGEVLASRLVALARAIPVPATTVRARRDRCGCSGSSCPFDGIAAGDAACRLAGELAERAPVSNFEASGDDLVQRYLLALSDAAGAVYFCRRVQHAGGHCWFSVEGPGDDMCGRVLAVSHAITPAARH